MPNNSSVNTVQHAKIEEAVFSVDLPDAPIDWLDSDHVICVFRCPFRGYVSKSDRIRSGAVTSYESVVSWRSVSRRIFSSEVPQ
jgi:hypothetical protein